MKKKILGLIEKDGFILFLFICVCLAAGGTIWLSTKDLYRAKEGDVEEEIVILEEIPSQPYLGTIDRNDYMEVIETFDEAVEIGELAQEDNVEELEFIEEESDDVEAVDSIMEDRIDFILPVEGEIITQYTDDFLIYSETLEAWVGHRAIDIRAKEGSLVLAAADGKIEEVYEDDLWGIVIVIDHGNKIKSKYANLATGEMVKPGLDVKKGESISKIGKTAKIEMLMEPHLHFEAIKDGEIVDPRSIVR